MAHFTTCDTDTEGHHSLDCCEGTARLPAADLPSSSFLTPSARLVVYGGGCCPGFEDAGRFGVEVSTWIEKDFRKYFDSGKYLGIRK